MNRLRITILTLLLVFFASIAPQARAATNLTPSAQEFAAAADECSKSGSCGESYSAWQGAGKLLLPVLWGIGGSNDPLSSFYYGKSAVAYADRTMIAMYQNPAANLSLAIRDMGQSLGFIPKQVYAQGIGFSGLANLLDIWKAFRNVAYMILAAIMVVIGFMVMFRQKIDPKTVVTVQNALPRIVVTLLLITFSYAIVGLLIDLMYVVLLLVISVLVSASQGSLGADTASQYLTGGFGVLFQGVFSGAINSVDDIVSFVTPGFAAGTIGFTGLLGAIVTPLIAAGTPAGVGVVALPILAVFIVAIVLIFAVVRLLFLLVGAYVQIILALLLAPFQLLAGALPGNNAFGSWLVGLVSNLLVFPITAGLLLIATILANMEKGLNNLGTSPTGQPLWIPPLLGGTGHGVAGVIALGMLLSIPSIVNGIKEAFKVKPIIPGGGFGGIAGIGGAVGQYGFQYLMQERMTQNWNRVQKKTAEGIAQGESAPKKPKDH